MKIDPDETVQRKPAFFAPLRPFYLRASRLAILALLFSEREKKSAGGARHYKIECNVLWQVRQDRLQDFY